MKALYKTVILGAAMLTLTATGAHGLDITVTTPGSLHTLVNAPESVTILNIKGDIDAADLYYIGKNMPRLGNLDLSGAKIAQYSGEMLNGRATYPANLIPHNVFSGIPLTSFTLPVGEKLTIDDAAFMGTALTDVRLPENVDSVGVGAFSSIPKLTSVTYPAAARVGQAAFSDCPALTTVEVGYATKIADDAFRRCTNLTVVNGSENLVEIGNGAFEGCLSLHSFAFGPALRNIGARAFASSGLQSIEDLAECGSLKSIGEQAFANIPTLASIALPSGLTKIEAGTFFDDSAVKNLTLPAGIITVGNHALKGLSNVDGEVILPEKLEEIGDYGMTGMKGVTTLVLPATLIKIGNYAMEDMTGLQRIDASALTSAPEVGTNVWQDVDQPNVTLTVLDLYEVNFRNADQWKDFTFDILAATDEITAEIDKPSVRGRFTGADLEIESIGAEMTVVRLYNAAGTLLTAIEPHTTTATIDTSAYPAGVFIVSVTLENGQTATLKNGRR